MSEYQYYEFQAVDRSLKRAEQDEVRALSRRAEVNARSARFIYNYGDFRGDAEALMWAHYDAMLYLAWLKACCEQGAANDEAVEPPIPAGLGELSEAHRAFIELFDLDSDLVAAAAQASPPLPDATEQPSAGDFERTLFRLLANAKERLTKAAQDGTLADVDIELGRELRAGLGIAPVRAPGQRTVEQLRELADTIAEQQAEAERQQKEAERLRALEALAKREPEAWQEVEQLCERKVARAYDEAVALLCRLNDVAQLRGESIDHRLRLLLQRWKSRPALLKRLKAQGLI